ncbi:MAG: 23S rRNA (pseudouridine(1915)-N(3))-methyltransferase RlmH, partial [Longimicrobiales bacterium]
MKVTILAVGKVKGPLTPAIDEFTRRAERYWRMAVVEVNEGTGGRPEEVMRAEGSEILERLDGNASVWSLTRKGTGITSRGLASRLESLAVGGHPGITFVLGGAFGLSSEVLARCDRKLTLSPMTLPHDLARLILLEQLY